MKKQFVLTTFFLLSLLTLFAQKQLATIKGIVKASDGNPVSYAYIGLIGTSYQANADSLGRFSLQVPAGNYNVLTMMVGFINDTTGLSLEKAEIKNIAIVLKVDPATMLEEVVLSGRSIISTVKETPFNVVTLDAKALHNSTMDLAQLLNKSSGVKIREVGGVGSDMSISLNGFTGRHVKLFMDGVPMQGFGSAFQLNNIPITIADRIEVYKGVVPIEFGADAIGGVINIVTNQSANSYADVSYSYGSFNTHRSNINLGHTTKSGLSVQVNAFQNYSDNNYWVTTSVLDLPTGNYSNEEYRVRRFNNAYHNETVMVKIGLVNKRWADRIFLGITLGQEEAEIQHANVMRIVYGQRSRTGQTILPSFSYEKKNLLIKGLNVRATANYNINNNRNIDTATVRYNWFGQSAPQRFRGEGGTNTLADYVNNNVSATANINYRINIRHSLSFNNVLTAYERKMSSGVPIEEVTVSDTIRRLSKKNVFGASYRYQFNKNWNFNLFGKHYHQSATGPVDTSTVSSKSAYAERNGVYNVKGYGLATTYFYKIFQFKASVEKAFRLPTDNELFGDEVLETGNSTLRAENSMNYNLGVTVNKQIGKDHVLYVDINAYHRYVKDFIRRVQEQRYGTIGNVNHGQVRNIGVDAEARFYFKNKIMIGGNLTYQDMRNRESLRSATGTAIDPTYDNRMPNIPYSFGNLDAAYYLHHFLGKNNVLSLNYTFNYVGEFFLLWEKQGNRNTKATLPRQIYHDLSATYSLKDGRYNITFEARNFTNSMLYDNFSLQKPGRSFNVKVRYFLMKKKESSLKESSLKESKPKDK